MMTQVLAPVNTTMLTKALSNLKQGPSDFSSSAQQLKGLRKVTNSSLMKILDPVHTQLATLF